MDEKQTPGCFVCQTLGPLLASMWPEKTREHFRSSRVEFLKGIRSLLDHRIEHLSHQEQKGERVTVE